MGMMRDLLEDFCVPVAAFFFVVGLTWGFATIKRAQDCQNATYYVAHKSDLGTPLTAKELSDRQYLEQTAESCKR